MQFLQVDWVHSSLHLVGSATVKMVSQIESFGEDGNLLLTWTKCQSKICTDNQKYCFRLLLFEGAEGEAFGDGGEFFAAAQFICAKGARKVAAHDGYEG